MKKNRLFMLGIVTVFVAILSLTLVSSTFARYTSTVTGGASAQIAKWSFEINDADALADDYTFNVNLADTVVDTVDSNADEHVASGFIAPGTKGSFSIKLDNISDVSANYTITLAEVGSSAPEGFVINGGELTISGSLVHTNGSTTVTIPWEWAFGAGVDNTDEAGGTVTYTVTIVFEQVD